MFTRHFSVFQIIPWNWKHLTNRKLQVKKFFRHVMLHSYLCYALLLVLSFSSKSEAINVFPKHILKLKAHDQSIQVRKKLFCHAIIKNYFCNFSWKFLIKSENMWRREIKEQAPQLTLMCRGRTVRSSHRRCCIRKLFLKILQYPQETPVLESIFKKVGEL